MIAYLDWDRAEDDRICSIVRKDIEANGLKIRRRDLKHLWIEVNEDIKEQNRQIK